MTAATPFQMQLSEAQFMAQITSLANLRGWHWLHILPGLNERGYYRTPVSGSLGAGWPDLVLVKGQRILFVELKTEKGKVTGLQEEVLGVLGAMGYAEVYVWRPSDWSLILEVLE
jgi:hypothetical protein